MRTPPTISREIRSQISILRIALKAGETLTAASLAARISPATGYRRCQQFLPKLRRRRQPRLLDAERQRILELLDRGRLSLGGIAREVRRDKRTVSRVRDWAYGAVNEANEEIEVRTLRSPIRCQVCGGRSLVDPCLVCAARRLT